MDEMRERERQAVGERCAGEAGPIGKRESRKETRLGANLYYGVQQAENYHYLLA